MQRLNHLLALTTSATLLLVSHAAAADPCPRSVEQATDKQKKTALEEYRDGMDHFDKGRWEEALTEFRQSFQVVASPNSQLMIARSLRRKGESAAAYEELLATIAFADTLSKQEDKYKPTAEAARKELDELKGEIGILELTVPMRLMLNGQELPPEQWRKPLVIKPGSVKFQLTSGSQTSEQTIDVAPGAAKLELNAPQAAPEQAKQPSLSTEPIRTRTDSVPYSTLTWVSAGVAVAGAASFAIFGLLNQASYDDLEQACSGSICPENAAATAETGRGYQTLANVGLGVSAVGVVSALYFVLARPSGTPEQVKTGKVASLGISGHQISLQGSF